MGLIKWIFGRRLSDSDRQGVADADQRMADVINESLVIANESRVATTKVSRLGVAETAHDQLKLLIKKHPFIRLTQLPEIERSTAYMRSPQHPYNPWHKTESSKDIEQFSSDFWHIHKNALLSDSFWADRIKTLRGHHAKRLALAVENLPLPGAFTEAAIATRALIREKRKSNNTYNDEIALLYWLAAASSFSIPYSKSLSQPGYNVFESIPGKVIKVLPFTYKELGYENLNLLNKTDIKYIIEYWGYPDSHTTLHDLHKDVWNKYEAILKDRQADQDQDLLAWFSDKNTTRSPSSH
jgi:hypothetical protein